VSRSLSARTAPVIGASKGIGEVTATRLAEGGVAVVLNYVGSAKEAEQLVEELRPDGGQAPPSSPDVSPVIDMNLTAASLCCREFMRPLLEEGASRVMVNSAGRAGLELIAESIALNWCPTASGWSISGRRVIATPINEDMVKDAGERRSVEGHIPRGQIVSAEEVAAAIPWLAGPEADCVAGSTLFLDGGTLLYPNFA
jgi:NAD(P)-dependent dehydrogenase (short-subunit alcohol dehydrogenase family)